MLDHDIVIHHYINASTGTQVKNINQTLTKNYGYYLYLKQLFANFQAYCMNIHVRASSLC